MNRRKYLLSAASLLTLAATPKKLAAQEAKAGTGELEAEYSPQIKFGTNIPMRDGVHLSATLYLPRGLNSPQPTIFALTPYIADRYHPEGVSFARHGFPFLAVDCRGRGDSEGELTRFFSEPNDGHDVVEWIARQPFCNGKVGACGISYVGFTQWATVRGGAPHLATIVPSAPCWVGFDFPLRYNIFFSSFAATWLSSTWGNTSHSARSADKDYWNKEFLGFLKSGQPFRKLDAFFGIESKDFQEWLDHPHQDEYWDRANPTAEQFANLTIPVLSITGIYDGDQPGTLEFRRHHLQHAGAKADHYLVIGPWGHPEVRKPKAEFQGIKVGPASLVDMHKLHREWYAYTMDEGPKPPFLQDKVAYYVMVADKWRYAPTLEAVTGRSETLYLSSSGNPISAFRSGLLSDHMPHQAEPDHYVYDPRDLSALEYESTLGEVDLTDQRLVVTTAGAKLVYHSEPFPQDTEVSGFFKLTAWIAINQPDTDFMVRIYDIGEDGSSMFLTEQHMRARYREGLRVEKPIRTMKPLRYDFDRFFFVSRVIRKNNRLRLVIQPNHNLRWQKNYNSGKAVADETMADARTVTVRLYHDAARPTALSVPIGRADGKILGRIDVQEMMERNGGVA